MEFELQNDFIIAGPKLKKTPVLAYRKFSQKVHAVVLHRTDSPTISSALNNASQQAAAHFYIAKNGDVYQKISLAQVAPHVGRIKKRDDPKSFSIISVFNEEKKKNYPERYSYNEDSIGIEVVGKYDLPQYPGIFEPVSPEQVKATARLVNFLLDYFSLNNKEDLYPHEMISSKTEGEGQMIYDSIINLLI